MSTITITSDSHLASDVAGYLEAQLDILIYCHASPPGSSEVDPEIEDEVTEVRAWIKQLREAVGEEGK